MKNHKQFAHRVDMWDDAGENLAEHLAGIEDFDVCDRRLSCRAPTLVASQDHPAAGRARSGEELSQGRDCSPRPRCRFSDVLDRSTRARGKLAGAILLTRWAVESLRSNQHFLCERAIPSRSERSHRGPC
jgi:hypothetical protein